MTIAELIERVRSLLEATTVNQWIFCFGGTVASYLVGSISFAYLASRIKGVDLRQHGSGNLGATNVARVLGTRAGVTVFALDVLKGLLPTLAALVIAKIASDMPDNWRHLAIAYGLGAMCGHMFPFYLGFRGGKAVATGCGVFLVLAPLPTLTALLVWVVVLMLGRYVSLASMMAALALFVQVLLNHWFKDPHNGLAVTTWFTALVFLMVVYRHRSNIRRLLNGTENRIAKPERKRRPGRRRARLRPAFRLGREARERLERLALMVAAQPNPARRQVAAAGYPGRRAPVSYRPRRI